MFFLSTLPFAVVVNSEDEERSSNGHVDSSQLVVNSSKLINDYDYYHASEGVTPRNPTNATVEVKTLLELADEVDDMDDSGEVEDRYSPAQKRRKAQLVVVQRIYDEVYPDDNPISQGTAKKWLSMCDNSAGLVLEFIQENQKFGQDTSSRKTFITNSMQKIRRREQMPVSAVPQPAKDPRTELAPKNYEGDPIPISEEYLEKKRRAALMWNE